MAVNTGDIGKIAKGDGKGKIKREERRKGGGMVDRGTRKQQQRGGSREM